MRFLIQLLQYATALVALGPLTLAFGHGHPISVTSANNQLVISGGIVGAQDGYVDHIYVETDSSGDPQDFADFPGFGPAIYWNVPGFEITGLAENSGLSVQTIARPVQGLSPVANRVLWYWNPNAGDDGEVEVAPAGSQMQIRKSAAVNNLLTPTTTVAPPEMKIAAPVTFDMNFHNHDLVRYLLAAPLPPDGAYAFFAQLTSDIYAASDPFLVIINNGGLDGPQMLAAADAINAAANFLEGDYNHDGKVDGADYVTWRNTMGTAPEYQVWRNNFGATSGTGTAVGVMSGHECNLASVPEPRAWVSAALAALIVLAAYTRPHRYRLTTSAAIRKLTLCRSELS
jgi:hypothetical protein